MQALPPSFCAHSCLPQVRTECSNAVSTLPVEISRCRPQVPSPWWPPRCNGAASCNEWPPSPTSRSDACVLLSRCYNNCADCPTSRAHPSVLHKVPYLPQPALALVIHQQHECGLFFRCSDALNEATWVEWMLGDCVVPPVWVGQVDVDSGQAALLGGAAGC